MSARYLVAVAVLIASFALDGPAKEVQGIVLRVIPERFLVLLAHGGDLLTLAAVVVIFFACGLVGRHPRSIRASAVLASALTATGLVVLSVKWLASRGADGVFRGFGAGEPGIMFPSGHTALAFAACAVIGMVWRSARWPAWVIAAGIAISRATLTHFLSDVVAGALIGVAVGQLVTGWAAKRGFLNLDPHFRAVPSPAPERPPLHD